MLTTYEQAQAVGICWLHNFRDAIKPRGLDGLHPANCDWCDWPQAEKIAALQSFNADDKRFGERRRRAFFALSGSTRLRLIREAQGVRDPATAQEE